MYKIDKLLKSDQKLFHTQDLALLWEITNRNTLYTTIKRYVEKNILIPIQKGFYSTIPLDKLDSVRIGIGRLHRFSYVSCETILVSHGIIFQHLPYITLLSSIATQYEISGKTYLVRKLNDIYLYNPYGIEYKDGIATASLERAVTDILSFNARFYFDNRKGVDWKVVKQIQKEVYQI